MQRRDNGVMVISASDLTAAADCEWSWVRLLDKKLGHDIEVPEKGDAMMKRAGALGDLHEQRQLQAFKHEGLNVVEIDAPNSADPSTRWQQMDAATAATLEALRAKSEVVFQAAFFDGEFQGFADFLTLNAHGEYEVNDTKLARKAKITALLQLAAYVHQLELNNIPVGKTVRLLLGDGTSSEHHVDDIMPVFLKRRERLRHIIDDRTAARAANQPPVSWNDENYAACGKCEVCAEQVPVHDDLLQVSGMRLTQRAKLMNAGITTMRMLAAHDGSSVDGLPDRTLETLIAQARAQVQTRESSTPHIPAVIPHGVHALKHLPKPSPGDIFFDFEGDPLYQEGDTWNLDYLFGLVDDQQNFTAFWAHNLAEEKQALEAFLAFVAARQQEHPDMHIYHYAAYEKTHLLSLAARHGVGEAQVDALVSDGVLVDLYPMVKQAFRIGWPSYSLKKLEPLYMGDEERDGVASAADSVVEYANYCELRDAGQLPEARTKLEDIEQYNAYDCRSTLADEELFKPAWSNQIISEARFAVIRVHPQIPPERVAARFDQMNEAFQRAQVDNWRVFEADFGLPDRRDNHVVAAALAARADVIVTFNVRDFPASTLSAFGFDVLTPDEFLLDLFDLAPTTVKAALERKVLKLTNPSRTLAEFLAILAKSAPRFAQALQAG